MLKALWAMAKVDLLMWKRLPLAVVAALLPPITMVVLLEVLSMAVTQQPVALVVDGTGPNAEKLASIIKEDDDAYLLLVTDRTSAARMLADQEVAAVITIPADFDNKMRRGSQLELTLNNVDIDFADDIRRSVDRSVARFGAPLWDELNEKGESPQDEAKEREEAAARWQQMERTGTAPPVVTNPYLIDIDEKDLRETNVEWMNYQVIPALVLLVLNVGLTGTALLCANDVERKTAKILVLSPQPPLILVAARLLGGFVASIIALVPALLFCVLTKTINPPASHWPALAAIFAATALCASGMGATLGTMLNGTRITAMASSTLATYLFLFGGGFTTIAFLPQWLRDLSALVPMRYAIDGMRQALFYKTLDGVSVDILVLCLVAAVACAIGSLSIRRAWVG